MKNKIFKYIDTKKVILFLTFILSFIISFLVLNVVPIERNFSVCVQEHGGINGCINYILIKAVVVSWLTATFTLVITSALFKSTKSKVFTVLVYAWLTAIANILVVYLLVEQNIFSLQGIGLLIFYFMLAVNLLALLKVIILNKNIQ